MKPILHALRHPLAPALLATLGLALLLWFVGPLVAIAGHTPLASVAARSIAIGLLLAALLLRQLAPRLRAGAAQAGFMSRLRPAQQADTESDQILRLRQRLRQAVEVLRHSELARRQHGWAWLAGLGRRRYLFELPWYLWIGAPGSGKTSALRHSGLRFPLATAMNSQDGDPTGPTRDGDWHFSDEAVLIDSAGRYTSQDHDPVADAQGWQGLLGLLRACRPRQPLNGVIVTISVEALLAPSTDAANRQADALRARLQELHARLDARLPIYLLVTQVDRVAGFREFFSTLDPQAREQVWGCTWPATAAAGLPADLSQRLAALRRRLQDRITVRLQEESMPERRAAIAGFDQQFAVLERALVPMLERMLATSAYAEPLMVRGLYFCSARQQGQTIDPLTRKLESAFGLDRRPAPELAGSSDSFFLTRLLREVVFTEQHLGGIRLERERRRRLAYLGTLALLGLASAALLLAWSWSYTRHGRYLAQVNATVPAAQALVERGMAAAPDDLAIRLAALESVAAIASTPARPAAPIGIGLFQGEQLDAAARQAHQALLRELLLPWVKRRLEQQLRNASRQDPEFAYEALKAYLMLHLPQHFDAAALIAWIRRDLADGPARELPTEQFALLQRQLGELLAAGPLAPAAPPDPALLAQVRGQLRQYSLAQRIHARIGRQLGDAQFPAFNVERAAGPTAATVLARRSGQPLSDGPPGLYTHAGYQQGFQRQVEALATQLGAEQKWVLGGDAVAASRKLIDEVRRLYLADYARIWEQLLADLSLAPADSLSRSVELARLLSGPQSPLPRLLAAIAHETRLAPSPDPVAVLDAASDKVAEARQALDRLLGTRSAHPTLPALAEPGLEHALVDERFQALHELVAGGPEAPLTRQLLPLFDAVHLQLAASEAALREQAAPPAADALARIAAEAARWPDPARSLLQRLVAAGTGQSRADTQRRLATAVASQVGEFCRLALEGRYPFVRTSARDVTREDFERLFAPGGLLDDFFQKQLAPHVDTGTRPWSYKALAQPTASGTGHLAQFQRAAAIRDAFFHGSALRLDWKLIELDPAVSQLRLEIDGQPLLFGPGQPERQSISWPARTGGSGARLQVLPTGAELAAEGPWALLRLLQQARTEALAAPEKLQVSFAADGQRARFELSAASVRNPLRLRELSEFRCPQGL